MDKPRILVMTAAGKTGMPIALQLLGEGFPVTAFVRREDYRSKRLRSNGADIVIGSITDIVDIKKAMKGTKRAYFCTPVEKGNLKAAAVFAAVAAEQQLESLVVMSQWLANSFHPSLHTREVWLADQMFALLPATAVTTINVGFFADNDMQSLIYAAQFGRLMLPYGAGLNAPPSNEDIARVVAEILARPQGHAGKTYRPTGPQLISPHDMAAVFTKILGHRVEYIDAPGWMMSKVMKGMGYSSYNIAQYQQYTLDYKKNAFALNGPTDVVQFITGREPEDFVSIARRYIASKPNMKRNFGAQLKLFARTILWMLLPGPKTLLELAMGDFSALQRFSLSSNSSEWRNSHELATKTVKVL